ncbi:AbrB/MazE/SpoVT family DNA-binding domain-containing protein [Lentzea tibetensis]|uniref:AbrB/MazE/SpoVT family DNA-binding domain-containing protein n=1 Tax=Lentzea tibetensis TaxID=2591470 RepID=A0A563EKI3_9PSEU|nr:AbrB/MazE/SpoVT family DNA-binding domain-containing protein [Lentzea tibetensis]TWP47449.1 AbrB/MazE/SpoVT family DNA-binding domain-containing protein [Lentzea tibetensis]
MRVTTKGQVTIPIEVREQMGIRPGDEVQFHFDVVTHTAHLVKIEPSAMTHGRRVVERLRGSGSANLELSTDEIMALMRGE